MGLNFIQPCAWALLIDSLPASQQPVGNSVVAWLSGLSSVGTALLGFAPLVKWLPFFKTEMTALFWIAAIVLIISVIPTLIFGREVDEQADSVRYVSIEDESQHQQLLLNEQDQFEFDCALHEQQKDFRNLESQSHPSSIKEPLSPLDVQKLKEQREKVVQDLLWEFEFAATASATSPAPTNHEFFKTLFGLNSVLSWILFISFFVSCLLSPVLYFETDFFGEAVYGGDPNQNPPSGEYHLGVRVGSLAYAFLGLVTFSFSVLLPLILRYISVRICWALCTFTASISLFLLLIPAVQIPSASICLVASVGLVNASMYTIPYSLVGSFSPPKSCALHIALLNSSALCGQIVSTLLSSAATTVFGTTAAGMSSAGGFGLVASFLIVVYLKLPISFSTPTSNGFSLPGSSDSD